MDLASQFPIHMSLRKASTALFNSVLSSTREPPWHGNAHHFKSTQTMFILAPSAPSIHASLHARSHSQPRSLARSPPRTARLADRVPCGKCRSVAKWG
eukprot:CAMPEP_0113712630 /NCGR_PEP_ID=MMETSP0038_2-20120614/31502_1 /TAXON_ID=2898 /ORGANISM="Cryptomonas paramecium" /LENGTH=97 /DNA_ID=CAMNT_0000639185 /DNA_START=77 /DNA_END=366 /DNA_ORIENTATION=- /assembly_acc=CAM_ASM_000170